MTKKIIELTNAEMNKLCEKHRKNCFECPLHRENERHKLVKCYKWIRAYYYFEVEWYKNNYDGSNAEINAILEMKKKEQIEIEQKEIDV